MVEIPYRDWPVGQTNVSGLVCGQDTFCCAGAGAWVFGCGVRRPEAERGEQGKWRVDQKQETCGCALVGPVFRVVERTRAANGTGGGDLMGCGLGWGVERLGLHGPVGPWGDRLKTYRTTGRWALGPTG